MKNKAAFTIYEKVVLSSVIKMEWKVGKVVLSLPQIKSSSLIESHFMSVSEYKPGAVYQCNSYKHNTGILSIYQRFNG